MNKSWGVLILLVAGLVPVFWFCFQPWPPLQKPAATESSAEPTTARRQTQPTSTSVEREKTAESDAAVETMQAETTAGSKSGDLSAARQADERYANGNLMARGGLKQTADGGWIKHGAWTNYWANGVINTFGLYENGEKIGAWPFWTEDSTLILTNQFGATAMLVAKTAAAVPPQPVARAPGPASSEPQRKFALAEPLAVEPTQRKPADAAVEPRGGCVATKYLFLDWNANLVAATLESLFPELLFEFDPKAVTLKVTGCARQFPLLDPLLTAARAEDMTRWQTEVERRLWFASNQIGLFRHSVYGFDLKKPSGDWKTVAVTPDATWAQRLNGKPVYGLTLVPNLSLPVRARQTGRMGGEKARLTFVALDLDGTRTASELGDPDAKLPLALWPQAIADAKWVKASAGDYSGRVGGLNAGEKTAYRSRALWNTGISAVGGVADPASGTQSKIVCDRFYVAQPAPSGDFTRLYFFMLTIPLSDYPGGARWLEDFVGGFAMPETPMQPILAKSPEALTLASQKTVPSQNAVPPPSVSPSKASPPARDPNVYQWRLTKNRSPDIQKAIRFGPKNPKEAEALWLKTLPTLSQAEHPEALWYLAHVQMVQGKHQAAQTALAQMEKETTDSWLLYQVLLKKGILQGHYLRQWSQAEITLQRAAKMARDDRQKREVACQLALVPYYKKQYRQALESLENLLKQYPTEQTADFIRPFIWWLKNCAEKKL